MTPGILGDFGTHLGELGPLAVQLHNSYRVLRKYPNQNPGF